PRRCSVRAAAPSRFRPTRSTFIKWRRCSGRRFRPDNPREGTLSARQRLQKEIRTVALTTLYFAVWFSLVAVLKTLLLEEYRIEFRGLSLALIGALIVAKVVLVLEYVPLGSWVRKQAALLDVVVRTLLYTFGVAIVLLLERAFETRHAHGGG